ncbi:hypothetical protein AHAS_Ahas05G0085200 [Arachis hypogaea]
MKQRSFFNIETATGELQISLKISQSTIFFSAEIASTQESREDFERKKKKQMKTRKETAKGMRKIIVHLKSYNVTFLLVAF